jgi:hypothetical protein
MSSPETIHPDLFQPVVDYSARTAFLNATTDLLKPAPIDDLLEALPAVQSWLATIPPTAPMSAKRSSVTLGLANGKISTVDNSSKAVKARKAISRWGKSCRFFRVGWTWIFTDYAEPTILLHALGSCEHRKWYFMEPRDGLHPELAPSVPQRGNEIYMDYVRRSDAEYRQQRKDNLRSVQIKTGALTRRTEARDARWTVRHLCLEETFADIADNEPDESGRDENKVGHAVRAFRRRVILP